MSVVVQRGDGAACNKAIGCNRGRLSFYKVNCRHAVAAFAKHLGVAGCFAFKYRSGVGVDNNNVQTNARHAAHPEGSACCLHAEIACAENENGEILRLGIWVDGDIDGFEHAVERSLFKYIVYFVLYA